jgi:hypothetical protein
MLGESSNIKFRENPFSGSRFVSRGRADDRDDEAVMAFCDFANVPGRYQVGKIIVYFRYCCISWFRKCVCVCACVTANT